MELIVKHFSELSTKELYEIYKVRVAVFVVEQNCPYQEVDCYDTHSYHIYLQDQNEILAYCRVIDQNSPFQKVSIGRVLSTKRRQGYAIEILKQALLVAKDKYHAKQVVIEAQTYAKHLYEKLGFVSIGTPFLEDGIEHIKMIKEI